MKIEKNMKTEKINVYEIISDYLPGYYHKKECVILYEDDKFKMWFYNGDSFIELIIKNRAKEWYQWGFDDEGSIYRAINYFGHGKLAKYKQDLIKQGFKLMQKIKEEKDKKYKEEFDKWCNLSFPTMEKELDFLFNNN